MNRFEEGPRPHDGRAMGRAAHRVIGRLLEAGVSDPTPEQILRYAAGEPTLKEEHVYRLAARQRLIATTAIYFQWFLPPIPPWRFVDFEVKVRGTDLDLVFAADDYGQVVADELKTGIPSLADGSDLVRQLERQVAEGQKLYGDETFAGVRALFLGAPMRSFFIDRRGARTPLFAGPQA